jgi:hypothetical protein
MSKFPNIVAYSVPGANYTGKPKKMFPHGVTARYQVLGNIDKLVSIVYYCGKRGYKFYYKEIERLGIKGFDITISLGSQRQFTYFKKRFD